MTATENRSHLAEAEVAGGTKHKLDQPVSKENIIIDGVLRYPKNGLKAIIVGGGIAGLFVAMECWRKGLDVEVLERDSGLSALGDVVGIGPSAWVTLHRYPTMLQEYNRIGNNSRWRACAADGTTVDLMEEYEYNLPGVAQHAAYPLYVKSVMVRSQLAKMLQDQCHRLGIPINYGVTITQYEEKEKVATAISTDGRRFTGDVVIAADGVGTKSHAAVLGKPTRAMSSGYIAFRAAIPMSALSDAPKTMNLIDELKGRPENRIYSGNDGHHHIVALLPQPAQQVIAIILSVKDDGLGTESWSAAVSTEQVRQEMGNLENLDPIFGELIKCVPGGKFVKWPLVMRDPQPQWTSPGGRIVQVGDAAHSFLPTSGSGACTAMEGCLSLAECLRLGGKDGVGIATKVHEKLRFQRTSVIQKMGISNRSEIVANLSVNVVSQGKWLWSHNSELYATENFQKARAHIEHGASFENTNMPPGHKFSDWTLADESARAIDGVFVQDLKTNGDWSIY
ncbi:monooxygenase [Camillea tinctor]|nr:monooxygenase [Camillea tinctor]